MVAPFLFALAAALSVDDAAGPDTLAGHGPYPVKLTPFTYAGLDRSSQRIDVLTPSGGTNERCVDCKRSRPSARPTR